MPIRQRVVLVELVVNDLWQGLDFELPLRRAISHVTASGKVPLVSGPYPAIHDGGVMRKVAVAEQVPYAWWATVAGGALLPDGHPDQEMSD